MSHYKIKFLDLLSSDYNYSTTVKIEVLNWMLKTGQDMFGKGPRPWVVERQLFAYSGVPCSYSKEPLNENLLRLYFLNGILGLANEEVRAWRAKERIVLDGNRFIPFKKDDFVPHEAMKLKYLVGKTLKKEFYHPDFPQRIEPYVRSFKWYTIGNGLQFTYDFTFAFDTNDNNDSIRDSGWYGGTFTQKQGESIAEFQMRVLEYFVKRLEKNVLLIGG